VIRLLLINGGYATFDNAIDLFDFVIERMIRRGDL
jgi:hypothetical protein